MTQTRAAQRYARAVMDIATQENALEALTEDFKTLRGALEGSRDLRNFLVTPVIDNRVKATVLGEIFAGKLGPVTERFLTLLTKKGRGEDLPAIVEAFFQLLDREQNVLPAVITTAVDLAGPQRAAVEDRLRTISGKNIRAEYKVDPELIGGFRALFGDTMIDASVRHQLDRIYESFVGGGS